jgi:hypothetical protein
VVVCCGAACSRAATGSERTVAEENQGTSYLDMYATHDYTDYIYFASYLRMDY